MALLPSVLFPPFRLDLSGEQLWHEHQVIELRPKTFAVLRYLVEHTGRLVTKDELLDAVWAGTVVSDTVLKSCIRELRKALGDEAQRPQYIETVHRRGYRFIAPLAMAPSVSSSPFPVPSSLPTLAPNTQHPAPPLVGREAELAQLHGWLEKALHGERQIIFVTGEPGIGKTTLVEAFLQRIADRELWVGRGQCIEQYGAGEAYMPILEALGRLCREPGGGRLIALLHQHAPTWLVQMPALLNAAEVEALQRKVQGATRERMLREMADAVDALTAERPLVLWLEDLHWSDVSTLNLLALLARRRERARLFVIGTYRPVDVIVREHPLRAVKQELQLHGQCEELALRLLTEEAVAEYLAVRFDVAGGARHAAPLHQLARTIHQRTEGNPLFMVNVVDNILTQGVVEHGGGRWTLNGVVEAVAAGVPENLRQLIERQLERLRPEERCVLEVASVAGMEFSAAAVAAGLEATIDHVEACGTALVRRGQFLQTRGTAEWPDGTIATCYGFLHALYREVTYERTPMGQRVALHQRIGEREEAAYGQQAGEIAAALAMHFERGHDYRKAAQYHGQAAQNAFRRNALHETTAHATAGVSLLHRLAATPERHQQELTLQMMLGTAFIAAKGFAAPEVGRAYARAQELCHQVGEASQLFPVLFGLALFYSTRAQPKIALEIETRLQHLVQRHPDSLHRVEAHFVSGLISFIQGELVSAHTSWAHCLALHEPQQTSAHLLLYGHHPDVIAGVWSAFVYWLRGYPEQAVSQAQAALTLAHALAHPYSLAFALFWTAILYRGLKKVQAVRAHAEVLIPLAQSQGMASVLFGTIIDGWALAEQGHAEEGIARIREGVAGARALGIGTGLTQCLAWLAEAYGKAGQVEEGLKAVAEALTIAQANRERFYEAELYRLKGELTLQQRTVERRKAKGENHKAPRTGQKAKVPSTQDLTPSTHAEAEAEACFLKAIEIARQQHAKSWELLATVSLARLWQGRGKREKARQMLAEIYNWFTEGFDTADLKEAKALLDALIVKICTESVGRIRTPRNQEERS
jgi:DNA-binding winged helix-turn-helix (wHTH) protein/predicted ATPase/type II secretory pathway predicted ATPase ExeA